MDLDILLDVFNKASANLAKLDTVWQRAHPMIPTGPARGTNREYEDLRRAWKSLLPGLPLVDGWRPTEELPDIDELGQAFIDLWEIGEPHFDLLTAAAKPGDDLDEYRFRLNQARRRAIRTRLSTLVTLVNHLLPRLVADLPRDGTRRLGDDQTEPVARAISEMDRLIGDTLGRRGRWNELHRHMAFGEEHDWHDIHEFDWPSVRAEIETATLDDSDPIPLPPVDLGTAASLNPSGAVSTQADWRSLDDEGFERLLFEILRGFPNYQNIQWLMNTRAPDRGRDLSAERLIHDDSGSVRIERLVVQAKHWQSRSVGANDVSIALAPLSQWEPPSIHVLVLATSGRFTADAVAVTERHNNSANKPHIELWPNSRLEALLSQRPDLLATCRL